MPGQVVTTGLAPANAAVDVNSSATTRQGEYYYKALFVTNTSSAAWTTLTTVSNLGGTDTRSSFVPQTPEAYTYDNDGNITADGRWTYEWDAENRLTAMETRSAAYTVGTPRQRLEFKYDYLGRRVQKRVLNWSAPGWSLVSERRFIYDGWNLMAQFETSSGYVLKGRYVWGIDLSGNLQDAGGVGGLLSVYSAELNIEASPAFDGNGNVYGLVDRTSGVLRATYEYSPYGETLRSAGELADKNPFRFSTKFTDNETQMVYYGFRYYSPSLGRFFGRDPIEEKGGLHLYAFCLNNPLNGWDSLGKFWITSSKPLPHKGYLSADDLGIPTGVMGRTTPMTGFSSPTVIVGNSTFDFARASTSVTTRTSASPSVATRPSSSEVIGHYSDGTAMTRGEGNAWEAQNAAQYANAGQSMTYGNYGDAQLVMPNGSYASNTLPNFRQTTDAYAPNSVAGAVNQAIASGNLLASNTDGMFSDGSIPWVSRGGEAAAAGMGGRSTTTVMAVSVIRPPDVEAGIKSTQVVQFDNSTGGILVQFSTTGTTYVPGVGAFSARTTLTSGFSATSSPTAGGFSAVLTGETGSKFFPANINYSLQVNYRSGSITLGGVHDGYPSYEVYSNGNQIYNYQQGHIWQLFGTGSYPFN